MSFETATTSSCFVTHQKPRPPDQSYQKTGASLRSSANRPVRHALGEDVVVEIDLTSVGTDIPASIREADLHAKEDGMREPETCEDRL